MKTIYVPVSIPAVSIPRASYLPCSRLFRVSDFESHRDIRANGDAAGRGYQGDAG